MFHQKTDLIMALCIILLFSTVSIAQGAPPLQGGPKNGASLGETLNLNEDGNNLGAVMSEKGNEGGGVADDGTAQHPVAAALAEYFGVPYEEIMGLHQAGQGFGAIAKAYFFAQKLDMAPEELLQAAHGAGWGNVLRQHGLHPGSAGHGHQPEQVGPPDNVGPTNAGPPGQNKRNDANPGDESVSNAPEPAEQEGDNGNRGGNGHGNGGGNGHGHGGGNGGGNGHNK